MSCRSFDRERHIQYFSHSLRQLPDAYAKLDTNRLTLVHFCVHALDLLGALETHVDPQQVINWIYSLEVVGGFCGGTYCGNQVHGYTHSHIAMTYTALATLIALGDDLSQVHKESIISSLRNLQRPNGSFQAVGGMGSECDMRFLYCACAISYMLNDWTGVDTDKAVSYIKSCVSFDGAIALLPGQEGHGGSTFCGVASLALMDKLDDIGSSFRKDLVHWCVSRQVGGMQGRPNKAEDTCYSYWIGGTLRLLNRQELLDENKLSRYVMTCQTPMGGFGKVVGAFPDVLHSFYSMAWLSLSFHHDLKAFNCTLGICQERAAFLEGNVT
jgi:geranylgeranyl transferase type-1 subunit beta